PRVVAKRVEGADLRADVALELRHAAPVLRIAAEEVQGLRLGGGGVARPVVAPDALQPVAEVALRSGALPDVPRLARLWIEEPELPMLSRRTDGVARVAGDQLEEVLLAHFVGQLPQARGLRARVVRLEGLVAIVAQRLDGLGLRGELLAGTDHRPVDDAERLGIARMHRVEPLPERLLRGEVGRADLDLPGSGAGIVDEGPGLVDVLGDPRRLALRPVPPLDDLRDAGRRGRDPALQDRDGPLREDLPLLRRQPLRQFPEPEVEVGGLSADLMLGGADLRGEVLACGTVPLEGVDVAVGAVGGRHRLVAGTACPSGRARSAAGLAGTARQRVHETAEVLAEPRRIGERDLARLAAAAAHATAATERRCLRDASSSDRAFRSVLDRAGRRAPRATRTLHHALREHLESLDVLRPEKLERRFVATPHGLHGVCDALEARSRDAAREPRLARNLRETQRDRAKRARAAHAGRGQRRARGPGARLRDRVEAGRTFGRGERRRQNRVARRKRLR